MNSRPEKMTKAPFRSYWERLNFAVRRHMMRSLQRIHSAQEFKIILQRQRALADRNSSLFSLVVFDLEKPGHPPVAPEVVANTLLQRLRTTDEVGWLGSDRIAALLPFTPAGGAWRVAHEMAERISQADKTPVFHVYTYPLELGMDRDHNTDPRQLKFTDVLPEWQEPPPPPPDLRFLERTSKGNEAFERLLPDSFPRWKRALDITASLAALTLLAPFLLLITAYIKIVSPGPALFKQERIGYLGRRFTCWKFRSMKLQADTTVHRNYLTNLISSNEPMTKLDKSDDPRLIPLGKLLRSSGIDEIPQLFNVLKGDMSLIGPRPCLPYEYEQFLRWHKQRFDTLPGLTGLWQVSGKNRTTFLQMIRFDIEYVRTKSFWLDALIVMKTLPALVAQTRDQFGGTTEREDDEKAA